jgi:hypothetical protein
VTENGYVYRGHKRDTLKVFGWTGFRAAAGDQPQTREIVAAKTQAEVLEITGMTRYNFKQSGGETGNPEEVRVANSKPGTVFWRPLDSRGEWTEA